MSELTPRTRMEVFLAEGSEARITPVTRQEHILAGEDIEPVTRIEFFMKEAASGGGGSATLIEKDITANGTYNASDDDADGYSKVNVAVPASAVDTGTKSINSNGAAQDVVGYAAVDVDVPNSYAAGDEGKVVHNGALVSQTSDTVTSNNTYDTTLINSLTVNVSGGGGGIVTESGTITGQTTGARILFENAHSRRPDIIEIGSTTNEYSKYGIVGATYYIPVGANKMPKTIAGVYNDAPVFGCCSYSSYGSSSGTQANNAKTIYQDGDDDTSEADATYYADSEGFWLRRTPASVTTNTPVWKTAFSYTWKAIWL